MLCSVPNCVNKEHSRNLCQAHYKRLVCNGDLDIERPVGIGKKLQWLLDSRKHDTDECIIGPFSVTGSGYCNLTVKGSAINAHRYVCERHNGPPPDKGYQASHSCGNRLCVNKNHLRWLSPGDNTKEKLLHGTQLRGHEMYNSRLTPDEVRKIRIDTRPQRKIASEYGVSQKVINLVKNRKSYRNIE